MTFFEENDPRLTEIFKQNPAPVYGFRENVAQQHDAHVWDWVTHCFEWLRNKPWPREDQR